MNPRATLKIFHRLALVLFLCAASFISSAAGTNYFCVVCGKGPLQGHFWMSKWGAVCDDCYRLKDHCSICGLSVKDDDGHIKTPDGRLICKFDKTNVVLTLEQAQELFDQTRDAVTDIYGARFALKYPDVTVNLFDVDYWSEKGRANGLHAFGFASTRKTADGRCTHEVVMLSGRTREEMTSVAAHEYTHLWINENCPSNHVIDGDTVEAICELTAYKLMAAKKLPEMQKRILANPYTNGKIKTLVAVEHEGGTDYVLDWVKNGKAETFDADANLLPIPAPANEPLIYTPPKLPEKIKFNGLLTLGGSRDAVINGVSFAVGDQKLIKLKGKTVLIRCLEIHDDGVVVQINDSLKRLTLKVGNEISPP
jgi:hypothetical protein